MAGSVLLKILITGQQKLHRNILHSEEGFVDIKESNRVDSKVLPRVSKILLKSHGLLRKMLHNKQRQHRPAGWTRERAPLLWALGYTRIRTMAQVKIYGLKSSLAEKSDSLSLAIHAAVVEALAYPPDKKFHRFHCTG